MRSKRDRLINEIAYRIADRLLTERVIAPTEGELVKGVPYVSKAGKGYSGDVLNLPMYVQRVRLDNTFEDLLDSLNWLLTQTPEGSPEKNKVQEMLTSARDLWTLTGSGRAFQMPHAVWAKFEGEDLPALRQGYTGNNKGEGDAVGLAPGFYPLSRTFKRAEHLDFPMDKKIVGTVSGPKEQG